MSALVLFSKREVEKDKIELFVTRGHMQSAKHPTRNDQSTGQAGTVAALRFD